jgi:hypothetical protein
MTYLDTPTRERTITRAAREIAARCAYPLPSSALALSVAPDEGPPAVRALLELCRGYYAAPVRVAWAVAALAREVGE